MTNTVQQKDKLAIRNQILDDYENKIGLPPNIAPCDVSELKEYLSMTRDVIESLGIERCIAISIRLSQYAFYLQRCINRDKSILTWAENELSHITSSEILQYDSYMKYEAKIALICKNNSAAKELSNIVVFSKQRIDRLNDLSSNIRNISYIISLIYKNKLGEK